jgi:hypothetical protein
MTAHPGSRRLVNWYLLLAGVACVFSGFLVQVHYHMAAATSAVWGHGYAAWGMIHQLASLAFLTGVAWHLSLNWRPLLACFARGRAWRKLGFFVVAIFLPATATALAAFVAFMVFGHRAVEKALVEIHDKLALPLFVLLVLHAWQRRSRLFRQRR